jgi:hypothetical protein
LRFCFHFCWPREVGRSRVHRVPWHRHSFCVPREISMRMKQRPRAPWEFEASCLVSA